MGRILNPDNEDFSNFVNIQSNLYIDKTDFISETIKQINSEGRYICFTRPRRFGKTMTAKMLSAYYSKGCESKELLANLKIAEDPLFSDHLNKYNVIYIDMNSMQGEFEDFEVTDNVQDIVDFIKFKIMIALKENNEFSKAIDNNPLISSKSLPAAIYEISTKLNEKFIFIMDEWDLVYREYKNDSKLQEKFINFLRGLFKADNKFSLAYLTGILPIKKYISQSALNNFNEFNMLRPAPYERYFGFTEEEVNKLAKEHNLDFAELKHWYDGYKLNQTSILNPNSVMLAVKRNCIQSYWTETSALDSFKILINMNFKGLKDEILDMLTNGTEKEFNCVTFQNDMVSINNKDDAYSLLVCLGYLACRSAPSDPYVKMAYVPNKEIRSSLQKFISSEDWFQQMDEFKRSQELYEATISLDALKVAEIIEEFHTNPRISIGTYNNELSLSYCVTTAYSLAIMHRYDVTKEMPAGKGFADIVFAPKIDPNLPVIIVELKYGRSATEAINQIKERQYENRYRDNFSRILLVGISYDKITKKHECIIEEIG